MKILLVEDDPTLIALLTRCFATHHYILDVVQDGEQGWLYGSTFEYDLVILDIILPKMDGLHLCQRFRAEGYSFPILLLTAQASSMAKVRGFDAGADDYLVKPFDPAELIARIRALVRRGSAIPTPLLSWGDLCLNPDTCEVTYRNQLLSLTTKEYDLLELLLRQSHHVFSIDEILDRLWSSEAFPAESTVRSHLRRLRQKLTDAGAPADFISTLHGRGYYLKLPNPDIATANSSAPVDPQAQYLAFLNETWLTTKPRCLEQLATLSLAKESNFQQAQFTAHKLAGALGAFGLLSEMQLVRRLEDLFGATSNHPDIEQITRLIDQLQAAINQIELIQLPRATGQPAIAASSEPSVMIVDDDLVWLQSLPQLLRPWGFRATTLAEPEQFWTVLQMVKPDLLILDVNMPQINGLELCQLLRRDPQWQRLPVLFLSVLSDLTTQNQAFTAGADDYLCKPISGTDLANRLQNRWRRVCAWAG